MLSLFQVSLFCQMSPLAFDATIYAWIDGLTKESSNGGIIYKQPGKQQL